MMCGSFGSLYNDLWLQCVHTCVCAYVQDVSVYLCMCVCVVCVCSREILCCFKYIIIHRSLYTIAVYRVTYMGGLREL